MKKAHRSYGSLPDDMCEYLREEFPDGIAAAVTGVLLQHTTQPPGDFSGSAAGLAIARSLAGSEVERGSRYHLAVSAIIEGVADAVVERMVLAGLMESGDEADDEQREVLRRRFRARPCAKCGEDIPVTSSYACDDCWAEIERRCPLPADVE